MNESLKTKTREKRMELDSPEIKDPVYESILNRIFSGELKPGEVLTEVSLSGKLGLSRTPIREALKKLEAEGLIETEGRTKKVYFLSLHDIEEIFDLKITIESSIAHKAAKSSNQNLKEDFRGVLAKMDALEKELSTNESNPDLLRRWLILDKEFHRILFKLAENQRAAQIIDRLNIQWHRVKMGITAIEGRIEKAIGEHKEIGRSIINQQPEEAALLMENHLKKLKEFLIQLMKTFQ